MFRKKAGPTIDRTCDHASLCWHPYNAVKAISVDAYAGVAHCCTIVCQRSMAGFSSPLMFANGVPVYPKSLLFPPSYSGAFSFLKANRRLFLPRAPQPRVYLESIPQVLPTLKFCAERDETVAIQLCVLGCYDAIAKRLEKLGPVATHILPACTPMLACKGLNSNQFEMAVGIVQGMLETVVSYRREQIANPSATAIIDKRPTHAGGEPDEAEISRLRAIALGGWKAAPPSAASKFPVSKPLSPISATFPGSGSDSSTAAAPAASSSGFDVFAAPPPSSATGSSSDSAALGSKSSTATGYGAGGGGGQTSGYGSVSSPPVSDIFQGLSVSKGSAGDTAAPAASTANGGSGGSLDPFASAGLGDAFGATGNNSAGGSGMSWMDGAFGGAGGSSGGMASSNMASGASSSSGVGGFSGSGGGNGSLGRATPASSGGLLPPPSAGFTSQPTSGVSSGNGGGGSGGDPFSAFFDAAIAGGSGTSSSSPRLATPSLPPPQASSGTPGAGGAGLSFMGGFGGPAATNGGGGGTLEDQLAKTQREIAQLTRELGGAGAGMVAGLAAGGGGGMAAAMGGAAASMGGWGMQGDRKSVV